MPNIPTLPANRPTLAEDLSVLAWLQITRDPLSPVCTSYLCGALPQWSMTASGALSTTTRRIALAVGTMAADLARLARAQSARGRQH